MSSRSTRKGRRQSRANKSGELQIGRANCGPCGAEFTFGHSKILQEFHDMGVNYPMHVRRYVVCPRCSSRLYLEERD